MFGGAVDDFYAKFDLIISRSNDAGRARRLKAINPGIKVIYTEDWNVDCNLTLEPAWYLKYANGSQFTGEGFNDRQMNISKYGVSSGYHDACAEHMTNLDWSVFDGVATDGLYGGQNVIGPYTSNPIWKNIDTNNDGMDDPRLHDIPPLSPDPARWGTDRYRSASLLPSMRNGLAVAMFNDAYFSFQDSDGLNEYSKNGSGQYVDNEHYWSFDYDEFDADMGKPTADKAQLKYGLWYRCFDKGVVVANTDGTNKTVSATDLAGKCGYNGSYHRLLSGQDMALRALSPNWAVVHDGSLSNSVTLSGRKIGEVRVGDAVFLVREPQTVVSDIVTDNNYMSTSPTNDWMVPGGFIQETNCGAGSGYYTVRCNWNKDSFAYATATGGADVTAAFRPTIGIAGNYEVFEWHGQIKDATMASNALYSVTHAGGTSNVIVNQQQNQGRWNSLGTYRFNVGVSGNVKVSAPGASGTVMADAVKFVYKQ